MEDVETLGAAAVPVRPRLPAGPGWSPQRARHRYGIRADDLDHVGACDCLCLRRSSPGRMARFYRMKSKTAQGRFTTVDATVGDHQSWWIIQLRQRAGHLAAVINQCNESGLPHIRVVETRQPAMPALRLARPARRRVCCAKRGRLRPACWRGLASCRGDSTGSSSRCERQRTTWPRCRLEQAALADTT